MENAGRAIARAIRARITPCRTLVLAGPGNNGGDGYVAARLLHQAGWPVAVAATAPPRKGTDAALAASRWKGPNLRFGARAAARAELVIDAVFGAGLSRDVAGVIAETLQAAKRVVAVDVPSGLDGATGAVRGFAPQAEFTVTFFRKKPGHLLYPGRRLCGELVLADIGLPASVLTKVKPRLWENGPDLFTLPCLDTEDHKYARGTVSVIAGTMTGAARLAAMAARRAGAGLVSMAAETHAEILRAGDPGVIVRGEKLPVLLRDPRFKTWVCGPGLDLGDAARGLAALVATSCQIVGDGGIFAVAAGRPDALRGVAVITPHDGEFTRVFGEIGSDRVVAARRAAKTTGAVVVLKGASSIIAAPDGRAAINTNAPAYLASAGTGDVLAGIIAAMLAQKLAPFDAALAGVWLHGEAGSLAGPGMIAEDLLAALKNLRQAPFWPPF
jgi:hydroxyethylthiazole kinase-like uncharacterized protein yjeF